MAREPERDRTLPLRAGAPLKKALTARGFVARLVVARKDGRPLTADDKRNIDATVHAYEGMDKIAHEALRGKPPTAANKPPASKPKAPRAPATSRRKAAKRPS